MWLRGGVHKGGKGSSGFGYGNLVDIFVTVVVGVVAIVCWREEGGKDGRKGQMI